MKAHKTRGKHMKFSDWLRQQMAERGYNQAALAKTLGVGQSTISNWLQGLATPSVDNLVALSGLFDYDHMALMEMVGIFGQRSPELPTGDEQQVVDRLKMLRGEAEYRPTIQTVISVIDLVLATKDSGDDTKEG